jgi:hypothetical protein
MAVTGGPCLHAMHSYTRPDYCCIREDVSSELPELLNELLNVEDIEPSLSASDAQ